MSFEPLFVTGTARGGTTLIARVLDTSTEVTVASDPYFPLFRSFRNALLREAGITSLPRAAPLQDYYFSDERIRMLDAVQAGELEVPLDPAELDDLRRATAARARLEHPELVPELQRLGGSTYRELFDGGLGLIARPGSRYAGCKEVWTIEFCAPLARAYQSARFVVIVRDVRAVLASLLALAASDGSQAAHPLSYARHWRKQAAFLERYRADPLLDGRLHVVAYEELVRKPVREVAALCDFLEVPLERAMLELPWPGNSSYQLQTVGFDAELADRWRTELDPAVRKLAELVCGPELGLPCSGPDPDILDHLVESDTWPVSWRSDLGDPRVDYECELARLEQLHGEADTRAVRRSFLFEEAYRALRAVAV